MAVDCSELALQITEIAMNIGSRPDVKNIDDIVVKMQEFPELAQIKRSDVVTAIVEATTGQARTQDELTKKLNALKREARRDKNVQKTIGDLKSHLADRTLPPRIKNQPHTSPTLSSLKQEMANLRLQIGRSEPAVQKRLEKSIAKLDERIAKKDFRTRRVPQLSTPQLDALRKKRDELRKKLRDSNPESPLIQRAKKRLSELESHLRAGTLPQTKPRTPTKSEELADLQQKTAALRKAINQSDPALKRRYQKSIDELTRRLEQGDFAPRTRKAAVLQSKELERLQFERDQLRREINRRIQALGPKTIWEHIVGPFRAARSLMTAFDVSAVGRQGLFIGLGNPRRALRNIPPMFRSLVSERFAQKANADIKKRPNAPLYARSKLHLSELDGGLTEREEVFMSQFAEKIPGVRASERAYVTYLNLLRADSFDTMASTLGRRGEVTQAEAEAIANYINVATGRGSLGHSASSLARAADGLSVVFFAPRLTVSRFQLLAGQPFFKGGKSVRVRGLIAGEYGKFLIGLGTVITLGLLAGGDFEDDPRSSDFGKLRFGNSRIDIMGGLSQTTVLTTRLATGQTKNSRGEIRYLRGPEKEFKDPSPFDVAARFLRTKFSPLTSTAVDVATGENVVGENTDVTTPEGAGRVVSRNLLPLSGRDIYEAIKYEGVPTGMALGLLSLFGFGLLSYESKKKSSKEKGQKEQRRDSRRVPARN